MSDNLKQRIAAMRQVAEPFRDEPYTERCPHCRMHMRRFNEEVTPANVLALIAELERQAPVVEAAVIWRREGYEGKRDFSFRVGPLIDAIDMYDVGHLRPKTEYTGDDH